MRKFKAFKFVLVMLMLTLACVSACAPASASVTIVTEKSATAYTAKNTNKVAGTIPAGLDVTITTRYDDGWCCGSYYVDTAGAVLKKVSRYFKMPDFFKTSKTITTQKVGYSYNEPSKSTSQRKAQIAKGTKIAIYYRHSDDWCYGAYKQTSTSKTLTHRWFKLSDVGGEPGYPAFSVEARVSDVMDWMIENMQGYRLGDPNPARGECFGFANAVYNQLFGLGISYWSNTTTVLVHPGSVIIDSVNDRWLENSRDEDIARVRELFQRARPGDFVQMLRSKSNLFSSGDDGTHSAIIHSIDDNGVTFYHANMGGDDCVHKNYYTWSSVLRSGNKFTLYHPENYNLLSKWNSLLPSPASGTIPASTFLPDEPYGGETYYFITSALSQNADQAQDHDHDMVITADSNKSKIYLTRKNIEIPRNNAELTQVLSQLFRARRNSDGSYSFINALTGKVLAIPGNSKKSHVQIQQASMNYTARGQKWALLMAPTGKNYGGDYLMIKGADGMYLEVKNGKAAAKKPLWTAKGSKAASQVFFLTPAQLGTMRYYPTNYKCCTPPVSYKKYNPNGKGYFLVSPVTGKVRVTDPYGSFYQIRRKAPDFSRGI